MVWEGVANTMISELMIDEEISLVNKTFF